MDETAMTAQLHLSSERKPYISGITTDNSNMKIESFLN